MSSYNVKQISDMLKTKPETVRRWIRDGKLKAEKSSRKEGNIITQDSLYEFLKHYPKYAAIIGTAAIPILESVGTTLIEGVGGVLVSLNSYINNKKESGEILSKKELMQCVKCELAIREKSVVSKKNKIVKFYERINRLNYEIDKEQKEIIKCKIILEYLENELKKEEK